MNGSVFCDDSDPARSELDSRSLAFSRLPIGKMRIRIRMLQTIAVVLASGCVYTIGRLKLLSCPNGSVLAQKTGHRLASNGCSKPSYIKIDGEEDFTHCCDRHGMCISGCAPHPIWIRCWVTLQYQTIAPLQCRHVLRCVRH